MGKDRVKLLDAIRPLIEERKSYEGRRQVHAMAAQIQGRDVGLRGEIDYLEGLVTLLKTENTSLHNVVSAAQDYIDTHPDESDEVESDGTMCPKCGAPPRYAIGDFKVRVEACYRSEDGRVQLGTKKWVGKPKGGITYLECGGGHQWGIKSGTILVEED